MIPGRRALYAFPSNKCIRSFAATLLQLFYFIMDIDLWGLDHSYFACRKVFISTILRIFAQEESKRVGGGVVGVGGGVYHLLLEGRPIKNVEIVGLVVSLAINNNKTKLLLDDGTGAISCIVLHNSGAASGKTRNVKVGCLAVAQGGIAFRVNEKNTMELVIDARQVEACDDPNIEAFHITECLLSNKVNTMLQPMSAVLNPENASETGWISELESKILNCDCGTSLVIKKSFRFCSCFAMSKYMHLSSTDIFSLSSVLEILLEMEGKSSDFGGNICNIGNSDTHRQPLLLSMRHFIYSRYDRIVAITDSFNCLKSSEANARAYGMFVGDQTFQHISSSEVAGRGGVKGFESDTEMDLESSSFKVNATRICEKSESLVSKCFKQALNIGLMLNISRDNLEILKSQTCNTANLDDVYLILSEETVLIPIFNWILNWIKDALEGGAQVNREDQSTSALSTSKVGYSSASEHISSSKVTSDKSIFDPKESSIFYVKMILNSIYPSIATLKNCVSGNYFYHSSGSELDSLIFDANAFKCYKCGEGGEVEISTCACGFIENHITQATINSMADLFKCLPLWRIKEIAQNFTK